MSTSRYAPAPPIHSVTKLIAYLSGFEGAAQSNALNRIDSDSILLITSDMNNLHTIFTSSISDTAKFIIYHSKTTSANLENFWHELMTKLQRSEHFHANPFKALIRLYSEVPLILRCNFLKTTYRLYNFNRFINTIDELAIIISPSVSGSFVSGHSNVEMIKSLVGIEKIHSLTPDARRLNHALSRIIEKHEIPQFILQVIGKSHFHEIVKNCKFLDELDHVTTEQMQRLIQDFFTKDDIKHMVTSNPVTYTYKLVSLMKLLPPSWQLDVLPASLFQNRETDWFMFLKLLNNTDLSNRLDLFYSFDPNWINKQLRPTLDKYLVHYFPSEVVPQILAKLEREKSRTNRIEEILATPYTAKDVAPDELEEIQQYIDHRLHVKNGTAVFPEIEPCSNRYQLFPHTNATQGRNATLYLGSQQTTMISDRMSEVKIADVIGALIVVPLLLVLVSWIHEAYKRGRDNHFQLPYHSKYRNGRGD